MQSKIVLSMIVATAALCVVLSSVAEADEKFILNGVICDKSNFKIQPKGISCNRCCRVFGYDSGSKKTMTCVCKKTGEIAIEEGEEKAVRSGPMGQLEIISKPLTKEQSEEIKKALP